MILRSASSSDIPTLQVIERESFDDTLPGFVLRQFIDIAGNWVIVAEEGAEVIGYALGVRDTDLKRAWALSAAVRPAFRSRGIATLLLEELFRRMRAGGIDEVLLTVKPSNEPVLKIAHVMKAEVIARDRDYFGPGEERLVMRKRLA